jgi:phospholipid/cholesterol/gamma-HCH transport system ATP-binding protein
MRPEDFDIFMRGVVKQFPGSPSPTLNGVDFFVAPEKIHTLLGLSGGGKSVTLKIILGLLGFESGEVWVKGKNYRQMKKNELHELRKSFGMLFQGSALFDSLSVFENVAFPLREHRPDWSEKKITDRVVELLEQVELEKAVKKMPSDLSGGMKKRVGLARAIALEPRILLFDEPTTGLDPLTSEKIDDLILSTTRRLKASALIISHNIHAAFRISDFVSMISGGKIIEEGDAQSFQKSTNPVIRSFLKSAGIS